MLPSKHRLCSTKEITATLHSGRCFLASYVRGCVKLSSQPYPRVACVVGKTVSKRAVDRHRYQRQLREVAHRLIVEYWNNKAIDMVLIAKPSITRILHQDQLYKDIERAIRDLPTSSLE